jgi:hypothetical protein
VARLALVAVAIYFQISERPGCTQATALACGRSAGRGSLARRAPDGPDQALTA